MSVFREGYRRSSGAEITPTTDKIYHQCLLFWKEDGIPLCTAGGHQDKPFIVQTGENRFFVAWVDYREDFGEESKDAIYGQHIDLSGTLLWEEDGVPISTSTGKHYPPFVASVGNGEWVVVWSNMQEDKGDIYLERF